MTTRSESDPGRELDLGPALRDVAAGAALIGIGLLTGGSSFDGHDLDRLDVVFDALGGLWMLWGLARVAYHAVHALPRRGS